jgi:hypothetical protein
VVAVGGGRRWKKGIGVQILYIHASKWKRRPVETVPGMRGRE